VVGGDRRDAAPVVDAGPEHPGELAADQVGRRLQVHPRAEHQPGDRDRGDEVVEPGVGWARIAVSSLARKFWTMTSCTPP
jgi:hypothetical protein